MTKLAFNLTRRTAVAAVTIVLATSLVGCGTNRAITGGNGVNDRAITGGATSESLPTIASPTYSASVGNVVQLARLTQIDEAVRTLRSASTSGWQAKQDDVTGVAAELSGGTIRYPRGTSPTDAAQKFLATFGAVFGIGNDTQVRLPSTLDVDENHIATLRTVETYVGIPVDGSSFLMVIRNADTTPEISFVTSHIFPDLRVSTEPAVTADAARTALRSVGVVAGEEPFLVISADADASRLVWRADGTFSTGGPSAASNKPSDGGPAGDRALPDGTRVTGFVDAFTGTVIEVRSNAISSLIASEVSPDGPHSMSAEELHLPSPGTPITLKGTIIGGLEVSVQAERLADGSIAFIDRSQPGANRLNGRGLNVVYDGSKVADQAGLPGTVATTPPDVEPDTDTITAAWAAGVVLDYYRTEHERFSFDGKRAPLASTVHVPGKIVECNAYFTGAQGQMVYAEPCMQDGKKTTLSMVDIGIVGHEITHGVTSESAAGINQSGQGGALNEGMSDYFGIIVQDRVLGEQSATLGITVCKGLRGQLCKIFPDGSVGTRNVDTGAIFDDYEFFLREPFGLLDDLFDYGGVHGNSLVWTNALWKIRKRFAAEDGGNLITSKGAKKFDRVVYRALTTYFTNETDMASAAGAVYQASLDLSDVTAAEQQMIVEQFVASELCDGCSLPATQNNDPVVVSSHLKFRPSVTKSGVVYTEYLGSPGTTSFAVTAHYVPLDGSARPRQISPRGWNTFGVVARGDYAFEQMLDTTFTKGMYVLHNLATGKDETVEAPDGDSMGLAAPAISQKRVLWAGVEGDHVVVRSRALAGGPVATVTVSDFPLQMGIDGDFAAFELKDGTIWTWDTTTSVANQAFQAQVMKELPTQRPGQIAVVGTDVFALVPGDDEVHWQVVHIGGTVKAETLSTSAFPAGLAADGNVVVWAETTGIVRTGVAGVLKRGDVFDSDLIAYNTASGHYGGVVQQRGQQGFPSLRGTHLVWQDSLAGADDIYGLTLNTDF